MIVYMLEISVYAKTMLLQCTFAPKLIFLQGHRDQFGHFGQYLLGVQSRISRRLGDLGPERAVPWVGLLTPRLNGCERKQARQRGKVRKQHAIWH